MRLGSPQFLAADVQGREKDNIEAAKAEKTPASSPEALGEDDVLELRRLAGNGDPTAAFLLGSSIWYRLVDPTPGGLDPPQILVVAGSDIKEGELVPPLHRPGRQDELMVL